ncbi:MAG: hypothetical protein IVW57_10460 [Ktedonobacterales bacterium]|nr:hypothetical protein [Ktedonobacterales bacterium]
MREDPRESINWRRHRQGCPHYRERWFVESDPDIGEPMYQVFCSKNTPPETTEEQERCLASRARCWRLSAAPRNANPGVDIPLTQVRRRRPA